MSGASRTVEMRIQRTRSLLVFFLALFMLNSVAAAARACTLSAVRHQHTSIQLQQDEVDRSCPEAAATLCVTHCVQEAKSGEQKVPADSPPAPMAPLLTFVYEAFRPEPTCLLVASSLLIVGPPLTILFGHLRI